MARVKLPWIEFPKKEQNLAIEDIVTQARFHEEHARNGSEVDKRIAVALRAAVRHLRDAR